MRLCNALSQLWYCKDQSSEEALDVEEAVLRAVIADGNYQHFHIVLSMIFEERAEIAMRKGDHDAAVKALAEAKNHAEAFDKIDATAVEQYTCPVLSGYTEDHSGDRKEDWTMTDDVKAVAAQKLFAPLSGRSDYQEILA